MTDLLQSAHEAPGPPSRARREELHGLGAWRALLRSHAILVDRLEARLEARHGLGLAEFDVLVQLGNAQGGALRMSELADRVVVSRSGMTRRIDRLEAAGLVRRQSCPSDRRGALAVITEEGRSRLEQARPAHVRDIDELFTQRLDPSEIASLHRALRRLVRPRERT